MKLYLLGIDLKEPCKISCHTVMKKVTLAMKNNGLQSTNQFYILNFWPEHWISKILTVFIFRSKRINIHKKKQQVEKPPEDNLIKCQQTFVMKMFDRSVDLAQFTENTPLYPICRAWIANQPNKIYNMWETFLINACKIFLFDCYVKFSVREIFWLSVIFKMIL